MNFPRLSFPHFDANAIDLPDIPDAGGAGPFEYEDFNA